MLGLLGLILSVHVEAPCCLSIMEFSHWHPLGQPNLLLLWSQLSGSTSFLHHMKQHCLRDIALKYFQRHRFAPLSLLIIRPKWFCHQLLGDADDDVTCPGRKQNSHFSTRKKAFVTQEKAEILVHLTFCLCEIEVKRGNVNWFRPEQTSSRWENTLRVTDRSRASLFQLLSIM